MARKTKYTNTAKDRRISAFRCDEKLEKAIKKEAEKHQVSVGEVVRSAVRRYLNVY